MYIAHLGDNQIIRVMDDNDEDNESRENEFDKLVLYISCSGKKAFSDSRIIPKSNIVYFTLLDTIYTLYLFYILLQCSLKSKRNYACSLATYTTIPIFLLENQLALFTLRYDFEDRGNTAFRYYMHFVACRHGLLHITYNWYWYDLPIRLLYKSPTEESNQIISLTKRKGLNYIDKEFKISILFRSKPLNQVSVHHKVMYTFNLLMYRDM